MPLVLILIFPWSGEKVATAVRGAIGVGKADVLTENQLCVFTTSSSIFIIGISEGKAIRFVNTEHAVLGGKQLYVEAGMTCVNTLKIFAQVLACCMDISAYQQRNIFCVYFISN